MALPRVMRSGAARGSTERLLRYVMRRKPCAIIMCVEMATIVLLVMANVVLISTYALQLAQIGVLQEQLQLFDEQQQQTGKKSFFWKCSHTAPVTNISDYNLKLCEAATVGKPYAFTLHEASSPTCFQRLNTVPCYEENVMESEINAYQTKPSSCAGLFNAPMPYALATLTSMTLAPRISEEKLRMLIGETVLAGDLHIKCPRCLVETDYYKRDGQHSSVTLLCARRLHTIGNGWPDIAEFCDEEEYHERNISGGVYCPRYGEHSSIR